MYNYELVLLLRSGVGDDRTNLDKYLDIGKQRAQKHLERRGNRAAVHAQVVIENGAPTGEWDPDLVGTINDVANSRISILGHGNAISTRMGGMCAEDLAALLVVTLGIRKVKRVSLLSCFAGASITDQPDDPIFAEALHFFLRADHGVCTEVSGRTDIVKNVIVDPTSEVAALGLIHLLVYQPNEFGFPADTDPFARPGKWRSRYEDYKLIWRWKGNRQVCVSAFAEKRRK